MHTFETSHRVAHSADEMFTLISAVEDYPLFLPLCEALEVNGREFAEGKETLIATMIVGYGLIRENFTTEVILDKASRTIFVSYLDGPFAHLENRWQFEPIDACSSEIDFYIAYSFRSKLLERLIGGLFDKAVRRYTDAFEARADAVYGTRTNEARSASA
ncbi:MAG TPA: SRPBCC family protein [Methyloceanibacter sp.]|jgi:coenzyme Q-binding protein COQ10